MSKELIYALDCQMRREKDATKRRRISLLMDMLREGAEAAAIGRQLSVMEG